MPALSLSRARSVAGRPYRAALLLLGAIALCGNWASAAERDNSSADSAASERVSTEPDTESDVISTINRLVGEGWDAAGVKPSPAAEEGEWCRRVYLDLIGRIPSIEELHAFLNDKSDDRRAALVDDLLESDEYIYHWSTLWTNLLVGRSAGTNRRDLVNRDGLEKFLRDSLAADKPYDRIVQELITATGVNTPGEEDFNGAVNFLLNNLEGKSEQATAVTARLFLGTQVQCTQCHNHPFNDWKQQQFWGLNAFFRQTRPLRTFEGRDIVSVRLVDEDFPGESGDPNEAVIFFEDRRSVLNAVFPTFVDGSEIPLSGYVEDVVRRQELAQLVLSAPEMPQAIVNRYWGMLFGFGFTKPVDDMGPHNPPTHPELLEYLSDQFAAHGYDLKQLLRWMALSESYSLSSKAGADNADDDPLAGNRPLFSRFYLRQMSAEQLYESLIVATAADEASQASYEERQRVRRDWLAQFTVAFGTDENDEASTFNGTIPQMLMMMNGALISEATACKPGSFLHQVATAAEKPSAKIQQLYLAALARRPSSQELAMAQKLWTAREGSDPEALKDLWWVLLNSNEFILNH